MRDGWLSWPCWLTDSGLLTHKVVIHPATSLAQDRESSLAETSVLPTLLRRQLKYIRMRGDMIETYKRIYWKYDMMTATTLKRVH